MDVFSSSIYGINSFIYKCSTKYKLLTIFFLPVSVLLSGCGIWAHLELNSQYVECSPFYLCSVKPSNIKLVEDILKKHFYNKVNFQCTEPKICLKNYD